MNDILQPKEQQQKKINNNLYVCAPDVVVVANV